VKKKTGRKPFNALGRRPLSIQVDRREAHISDGDKWHKKLEKPVRQSRKGGGKSNGERTID